MKQITFHCLFCNKRYIFATLGDLYKFKREYYIVDQEGFKTRNAICNRCYGELFDGNGDPIQLAVKRLYRLSGQNPNNLQAIEWDDSTIDRKVLNGEIRNKRLRAKIKGKILMPVASINKDVYGGLVSDLLVAGCSYQELSDCAKGLFPLAVLVKRYLDY